MSLGIDPRKPWFSLMEDDQQEGPLTLAALHDYVRKGRISADTLVWQQGMKEWQAAGDIPQLGMLFGASDAAPPAPQSGPPVLVPSAGLTETLATTQPDAQRHSSLGPLPQGLAATRAEASNPADLAAFLFADLSGPREPTSSKPTPAAARSSAPSATAQLAPSAPPADLAPEEATMVIATRPSEGEDTTTGILPRFSWNPQYTPILGAMIALSLVMGFAIALWNYR